MSENGKDIEMVPALPASRQAAVEQGIMMFQETAAERDELARKVAEQGQQIAELQRQLTSVDGLVAHMESRIKSHQLERDQAIAERAVYESLFVSIRSLMHAFKVPAAPLVREVVDAPRMGGGDFDDEQRTN